MRLPLLLVLVLAAVALTASDPAAARTRIAVAPHVGQVVRTHHVHIRLPAAARRVRLNRVDVTRDLTRGRRGARRLVASASHGLRHGPNVLRFKTTRKRTIRFVVRTRRPLVGAGRDRKIVVGDTIALTGRAVAADRDARRPTTRWRLVRSPHRGGRALRAASAPPAALSSPDGATAGFTPTVPGTYTLRLTAGGTTSDRVTLEATPGPLVPVDTMAGGAPRPGIKVGATLYPATADNQIQVLVLERETLGLVSNTTHQYIWDAERAIAGLDASKLVIVSLAFTDQGIGDGFAHIGVPSMAPFGHFHGFSAIGVPGMKGGDAEYKFNRGPWLRDGSEDPRASRMTGYLTPDVTPDHNYGFVPDARTTFAYGGKEVPPCTPGPCGDGHIGFRVDIRDAYTLGDPEGFRPNADPRMSAQMMFDTNGRGLTPAQQAAEARRMADALDRVRFDDVVTIQAVSSRAAGETDYPAPVGKIDKASMTLLASKVAGVGGTRNAFNLAADVHGKPESGGAVYTLVGSGSADEGNGAEVAAGVDGAGDAPELSGVLRPDRASRFRWAQVKHSLGSTDTLGSKVLEPPTDAWPLDGDPGAQRALSCLGQQINQLGGNPRTSYWKASIDASDANRFTGTLNTISYAKLLCDGAKPDFAEAQFDSARDELVQELTWVGNVRSYLGKLSTPASKSGLQGWADAQTVADKVYRDLKETFDKQASEKEVTLRWLEFVSIILNMFGPITHEASSVMADSMELAIWAAGADASGAPDEGVIKAKANELGQKLIKQAAMSQTTFDRMGDIIVSDYEKLQFVGKYGACTPDGTADCPAGWSFTKQDQERTGADLKRGVRRTAYMTLLPLGLHVMQLARTGAKDNRTITNTAAPDVRRYGCDIPVPVTHFLWRKATEYGSTSFLRELDPAGGDNGWDAFVFRYVGGRGWRLPSAEFLKELFEPITPSSDPDAPGLSISEFVRSAKPEWFLGSAKDERRYCRWWAPDHPGG